jgi:hypothetical protein
MTTPRLFESSAGTTLPVEHLCDMSVELRDPVTIDTPTGLRMTHISNRSKVTGKITGELLEGGSDYVVMGTDGVSRLDIRQTIITDDGAPIHFEGRGVARLPADARERLARGEVIPFADSYFRLAPRFETSDERYRWLNGTAFVGIGEFSAGHIDWRIYRIL